MEFHADCGDHGCHGLDSAEVNRMLGPIPCLVAFGRRVVSVFYMQNN